MELRRSDECQLITNNRTMKQARGNYLKVVRAKTAGVWKQNGPVS